MTNMMHVVNHIKGVDIFHTQAPFKFAADGVVVCNKNYRLATKICSAEEINQFIKELSK